MNKTTTILVDLHDIADHHSVGASPPSIGYVSSADVYFDYGKQMQAMNEVQRKFRNKNETQLLELLFNAFLGIQNVGYLGDGNPDVYHQPRPVVALNLIRSQYPISFSERVTELLVDVSPETF